MSNLSRGSQLAYAKRTVKAAVRCKESSATEIRVNFALRDALVGKEAQLENLKASRTSRLNLPLPVSVHGGCS